MFTYFFVIFEVHHIISRYNVCLEKYMDLLVRLRTDTTSEDTEPMRRTRRSESQKKIKLYSHILLNIVKYRIGYILALTKDSHIFTYFYIFSVLKAPYIEPL